MFLQNLFRGPGTGTFTDHTLEILVMLAGTFLLGLWLGWLLWSKYKRLVAGLQEEKISLEGALEKQRTDFQALQTEHVAANDKIVQLNYSVEQLTWEKKDFGAKINQIEADLSEQLKINKKLSTDLAMTVAENPISEAIDTEVFSSPINVHLESLVDTENVATVQAQELEVDKILDEVLEWQNIDEIDPEIQILIQNDVVGNTDFLTDASLEPLEPLEDGVDSTPMADETGDFAPSESNSSHVSALVETEWLETVVDIESFEEQEIETLTEVATNLEVLDETEEEQKADIPLMEDKLEPTIEVTEPSGEQGFSRSKSSSMIVKHVVIRADRSRVIEPMEEELEAGDIVELSATSEKPETLAVVAESIEPSLEIIEENPVTQRIFENSMNDEAIGILSREHNVAIEAVHDEVLDIPLVEELETQEIDLNASQLFQSMEEEHEVTTVAVGDDFLRLVGITVDFQNLLAENGITTYNHLSRTSMRRLKEILGSGNVDIDPQSWPAQALLAANNEWTNLDSYQKYLNGNKES